MPIEFQIPTLRVQATEKLDELESEQIRKEKLLELEERTSPSHGCLRTKTKSNKAICGPPSKTNGEAVCNRKTGIGISN